VEGRYFLYNSAHDDGKVNPRIGAKAESSRFAGVDDAQHSPSLHHYLQIVRRRLWVIVVTMLVLTGATLALTLVRTPTYEASIKILVGQEQGASSSDNLGSDVQGLQQLTQTLAAAVKSRPIADTVVRRLDLPIGPDSLMQNLQVEQIPETQLIQLTYTATSPESAQRVANTIGEVFSTRVSKISGQANGVSATIWEPAVVPKSPANQDFVLNITIALMLGMVLGAALALLLEYTDDKWRSAEEVERTFGIPILGAIPALELPRGEKGR
jgi:capsular polysaccharide biosynthesis protein